MYLCFSPKCNPKEQARQISFRPHSLEYDFCVFQEILVGCYLTFTTIDIRGLLLPLFPLTLLFHLTFVTGHRNTCNAGYEK